MQINSNPQDRYRAQDIMVNSIGSVALNKSYRNVNEPVHVEPAVKIQISQEAMEILHREKETITY